MGPMNPGPTQHKREGGEEGGREGGREAGREGGRGGDLCGAGLGDGRRPPPRTGAHHRRLSPSRRCHLALPWI